MEYVTVRFPASRKVFINGEAAGETNIVLRMQEGVHTFDLGSPADYQPLFLRLKVAGTTPAQPLEVTFGAF